MQHSITNANSLQVDVETVMRKFQVRRGDIQDLQACYSICTLLH